MSRPLKSSRSNEHQTKNKVLKSEVDELQSLLLGLLDSNHKVVVLASALSTHTLPLPQNYLAQLVEAVAKRYPDRLFGLGDLLEELVPTVNRLSSEGFTPLILLSPTDLAVGYARISAICLQRLPLIILLDDSRESSQTIISNDSNPLSLLLTLQTLSISIPSGARELKYLLQTASVYRDGPLALLYHHNVAANETPFSLRLKGRQEVGKAYMAREGKDLAILAVGPGVEVALKTAHHLATLGIEATVIDAVWVRPLDAPMITAVAAHLPRLITIESGKLDIGFGTMVLELIEQTSLFNVKIKRLSVEQSTSHVTEILTFLKRIHDTDGFSSRITTNNFLTANGE